MLVTFRDRCSATLFAREMKKHNISCIMMPTPRALSASCGISALLSPPYNDLAEVLQNTEYLSIYRVSDDEDDTNYTEINTSEI